MIRLGYVLGNDLEWGQRRARGFTRACSGRSDVRVHVLPTLPDDLREFPLKIDGWAGSLSEGTEARLAVEGKPCVSLYEGQVTGIGRVVTDLEALGRMVLELASHRGRNSLATFGDRGARGFHQAPLEAAIREEASTRGVS